MSERAREAQLTIGFDGDRVIGELRDEHGVVSAFSGWLELISAVDPLATPVTRLEGSPECPPSIDRLTRGVGVPQAQREGDPSRAG